MKDKKIFIFDEEGFSRVCHALLELDGYQPVPWKGKDANEKDCGLIITSFPYGAEILEYASLHKLPVLVLSDALSRDLLSWLHGLRDSFCMIKPVDFNKFSQIVAQMMSARECENVGFQIL